MLVLFFFSESLYSRQNQEVRGFISDDETGRPISSARVYVDNSNGSSTFSDSLGYFNVGVVDYPCVLKIDHPGYKSELIRMDRPSGGEFSVHL